MPNKDRTYEENRGLWKKIADRQRDLELDPKIKAKSLSPYQNQVLATKFPMEAKRDFIERAYNNNFGPDYLAMTPGINLGDYPEEHLEKMEEGYRNGYDHYIKDKPGGAKGPGLRESWQYERDKPPDEYTNPGDLRSWVYEHANPDPKYDGGYHTNPTISKLQEMALNDPLLGDKMRMRSRHGDTKPNSWAIFADRLKKAGMKVETSKE